MIIWVPLAFVLVLNGCALRSAEMEAYHKRNAYQLEPVEDVNPVRAEDDAYWQHRRQ